MPEVSSPQEVVELGCYIIDQMGERRKTFRKRKLVLPNASSSSVI